MNKAEIADAIEDFADAAYRAFQAGLDGLELHSSNGYLINQFLSSAINQRGESDYGGEIGDPSIPGAKEGRARFVCDIIRAIREKLPEMFLSMKLSVVELDNATRVWPFHHFFPKGNSIEESIRIAKWVEKAGASAIHVSTGSMFPHPRNPAGPFPLDMAWHPFQSVVSSGRKSFALFYGMRFLGRLLPLFPALRQLLRLSWARTQADFLDGAGRPIPSKIEGLNLSEAAIIKKHVSIPVICTGGFQTAEGILRALRTESCDIVSIARGLLANPTLPNWLQAGNAGPERPCSYCNRCLVSVLEHPLGCYDLDRFDGDYDKMIDEVMSIFPDKTPDEWAPAIT